MNILPADKYFVIGDREGFVNSCRANTDLIKVFDKIGPVRLKYSQSEDIYNEFITLSGKVVTSEELAKIYSADYSYHITKNEAIKFLVEWPNLEPEDEFEDESDPNIVAIPEIRLTITTMEEAHAAYIMLKGLLNASV